MADNTVLPGTGDSIRSVDKAGKKSQVFVLDVGGSGAEALLDAGNPMPTLLIAENVGYAPMYGATENPGTSGLTVDPSGQLVTRSTVLTDEGTFRVNFANASLAVSIGSVTIAGNVVTGTGFDRTYDVNLQDYFKLDADGETAWVQIDSVDSDTQLTLIANYTGGVSGAASRALIRPVTGAGGAIAVANGTVTLTAGTTTAAITRLTRNVDVAPIVFRTSVSESQRILNQTLRIGLSESFTVNDRWFARFKLDGTVNTTVICETGRNPTTTPSAAETESTTITIPNGKTSAVANEYRIEMLTEAVRFFMSGVLVATHSRSIPAQHDAMEAAVTFINGTTPATSTTATIDYITCKNHNKLEVGILSEADQIIANQSSAQMFAFSQAGVIAINTDLLVIDCAQLRSLSIHCEAMGTTGVVTAQWSNSPAFAAPITATLLTENGTSGTTFNAAGLRTTPVRARYCRLRLTTATTAGTTTINVAGFQTDIAAAVATQPVSGTITAGVTGYPAAAGSADGLANPTVTKIDATGLLFNGTTWDRARANFNVNTGDTGAKTTTFNGATQTNYNAKGCSVSLNVGTVSGTTPTLVAKAQFSPDGGTTWADIAGAVTPSITASGVYTLTIYPGVTVAANAAVSFPLPRTWRLVYTIAGTTPSFTLTNVQVAYIN